MSNTITQSTLEGCVYAVTGGAGALGAAVSHALAERGATVRVLDHGSHTGATSSEGDLAARITHDRVDLTDERAVTEAFARFERLDGSIHCAGGFDMKPITETTLADLEAMWRMNTVTCFLACREAVRSMRRSAPRNGGPLSRIGKSSPDGGAARSRGWIVNVAARPVVAPVGGMIAYAASKSAVANLTQSLAAEVLGEGILVNAILPSIMDTPRNRADMPNADHAKWPSVANVAAVIRSLASPSNQLTSGALVPVYGLA